MNELTQIKEIIATLNLESETTLEIVREIKPLLAWKFVYFPAINQLIAIVGLVVGIFLFNKFINKMK